MEEQIPTKYTQRTSVGVAMSSQVFSFPFFFFPLFFTGAHMENGIIPRTWILNLPFEGIVPLGIVRDSASKSVALTVIYLFPVFLRDDLFLFLSLSFSN